MCLLFSVIFYLLKEFEVHSKHHRVLKKCGHPFQNHLRLLNITLTKQKKIAETFHYKMRKL